ncbi:MAG: hypothetical protein V4642_12895 [Bacteroidota bacterium]
MKANLLKIVFVFLIVVCGFKASAQDISPVRHYVGLNYNVINEDTRLIELRTSNISAPHYGSYSQWTNNFGIVYEYSTNSDSISNARSSSFIGRLNYYKYNSFGQESFYANTFNIIHDSVETGFRYRSNIQASYSVVNLALAWKKQFFKTPVYLSIGPNLTLIPSSEISADIKLDDYLIAEGQRFIPESGVELSEDNTRAKLALDEINEKKWEIGLQFGVFVEFTAPNFLYSLTEKPAAGNSIVIAPYGMIYMAAQKIKEIFIEPQSWEEKYNPWRRAATQVGLDIRMPMPF